MARVSIAIVERPLEGLVCRLDDGDATGAQVTFSGHVRDEAGAVRALYLEHYAGMTEKSLHRVAAHADRRWPLTGMEIVHRIGEIPAGAEIVRVTVRASHRRAAFEACAFLMDILKTQVPLWKKELRADGWHWVDAHERDTHAAARWMTGQEQEPPAE